MYIYKKDGASLVSICLQDCLEKLTFYGMNSNYSPICVYVCSYTDTVRAASVVTLVHKRDASCFYFSIMRCGFNPAKFSRLFRKQGIETLNAFLIFGCHAPASKETRESSKNITKIYKIVKTSAIRLYKNTKQKHTFCFCSKKLFHHPSKKQIFITTFHHGSNRL